jgi:Flp pilus assembly protein TadG
MVAKKKSAKKAAKKPAKKAAAKATKAAKSKVKATKKTSAKKPAKKAAPKPVVVQPVTDTTGTVTMKPVDDPGTATQGDPASVKPSLDKETGVITMVPQS